jgi:hypothetical protein
MFKPLSSGEANLPLSTRTYCHASPQAEVPPLPHRLNVYETIIGQSQQGK